MDTGLTDQQRRWLASVRKSLAAKTSRSIEEWVAVARSCPETAPRARLRWFKEEHGLGQNYASIVFGELARSSGDNPREPLTLAEALWRDPAARAVFHTLERAVAELGEVVTGQRKGFTSWSRAYAFAAARPVKGAVRLGLAVEPSTDPRLHAARNEGWSERLKASLDLATPEAVDGPVHALLRAAWERS